MKKAITLSLLLIMLAGLCAGCIGVTKDTEAVSGGWGTYTIRVALENSETFPAALGLRRMKEYIESRTGYRVKVDIYANGQMGSEADAIEQVINGTLEMAVGSIAPLGVYQNKLYALDIPFMFDTYDEAWMVLDSHIGTGLLSTLEATGLKGLAFMENGFRHTTNNIKPITCAADYKGLHIRTMQNANHMAAFSALGASPTPAPLSELYMALSQKMADGQENSIANVLDKKLYEVQKYLSLTGHLYDVMPLCCNLAWWDALPAEYKEIIATGAIYGQNYSRFCNAAREERVKAILLDNGVQINGLTPAARAEIKSIAMPAVRDLVKNTLGDEYVDIFLAEVEAVKDDIRRGVMIG